MALNLGLGFLFRARDLASPQIRRLTVNMRGLNASTVAAGGALGGLVKGKTILGLGTLASGLLAVGSGFALADAASNFQQQLVATQKIMGATNEELGNLKEKVLDVGLRTKFSPDEIVEGMKNMGAMGLKAGEAIDAIEPAALLATAGQIGLDDASRAVVGTLRSFQMEAGSAGLVADKLAKATMLSNLQAPDFARGFSKAAATMGAFGQGLDDTLVTMGLLRNMNIDASSSGTALREGIRRLASDQAVVNKVQKAGVEIYSKQTGEMRGFSSIMLDLIDASREMTEEKRNELSATVFGARGLLSFAAVSNATFRTVRNGREVLLKGREAFEAMREEIQNAEGTVKDFNDAMLDTFEGQKQILVGAIDTLKVVMGEGIATVLKPVVRAVAESVSAIAKFVKDMSPETKEIIGKLMLVGGAVLSVLGAVMLLPTGFLAVFGIVGAAIAGFKRLADKNIGGIGDTFRNLVGKVWLFLKGLTQLITDGFLSGDTMAEIMREENSGVLRTLKTTVQIGFRIKRFFEGVAAGFEEAFKTAGPIIEEFKTALVELGEEFGFGADGLAGITSSSEEFANKGKGVGVILGELVKVGLRLAIMALKVAKALVKAGKWIQAQWENVSRSFTDTEGILGGLLAVANAVVSAWMSAWQGFSEGIREGFEFIQPAFDGIAEAVDAVVAALRRIGAVFGLNDEALSGSTDAFRDFGEFVGKVVSGVVGVFATVFAAVAGFTAGVLNFWAAVLEFIKDTGDKMLDAAEHIPSVLRPESLDQAIEQRKKFSVVETFRAGIAGAGPEAALAAGLAAGNEQRRQNDPVVQALGRMEAVLLEAVGAPGGQNIQTTVKVDGEKIAEATASAERAARARELR